MCPNEVLDDLRARLALTRPPLDEGNEDWSYGVPDSYLRGLIAYWRDGYDWRKAEAAINADELYGIHIGSGLPLDFFNGRRAWDLAQKAPLTDDQPAEVRARIIERDHRSTAPPWRSG
jgi:hypothetical protein